MGGFHRQFGRVKFGYGFPGLEAQRFAKPLQVVEIPALLGLKAFLNLLEQGGFNLAF
ncbi:hypothetical protein D3C73_1601010 [compost metagenome]